MNTIKKLILVNLIAVFGILGMASISPVSAQTTETSAPATSFQDALTKFREAREQFRQSQEEVKTSREGRGAAREQKLLERRKIHLMRIADTLIKRSEEVKNRVMKNKIIYGDLESSIIAEIDADIVKLNEFKVRVTEAQTAKELKNLAEGLRSHRKDVQQVKIRRLLLLAHIGRFEKAVLNNAEARSARIAAKLTELKNAGKDVSALETLLADANAKIASAKDQLAQLKNEVNQQELSEIKLAEIRTKLNEIRNQIKDVYDIFRQIATQGQGLVATPTIPAPIE